MITTTTNMPLIEVPPVGTDEMPLAQVRARAERIVGNAHQALRDALREIGPFYIAHHHLDQILDNVEFAGALDDWMKWAQAERSLGYHRREMVRERDYPQHIERFEMLERMAGDSAEALKDLQARERFEYLSQVPAAAMKVVLFPKGRSTWN